MDRKLNLCMLCCHSYTLPAASTSPSTGDFETANKTSAIPNSFSARSHEEPEETFITDILNDNLHFKTFCAEVEAMSRDNLNLTKTHQNFSADILFNSLDFFKRLSVCPQCLRLISKVNESKAKTYEREENVRRLQLQILTELRELEKQVKVYYEEMISIEKVITNSDVSCLENFLEGFMPPMEKEMGSGDGKGIIHKASVILFRNNILAVINDLQSFQHRLTTKLDCVPSKSTLESRPKRIKHSKKKPKTIELDPLASLNPLEIVEVKTELTELGITLPDNDDLFNLDDPITTGRNPSSGYGLRKRGISSSMPTLNLETSPEEPDANDMEFECADNPDDDIDFQVDEVEDVASSGSADSSEDSVYIEEEQDVWEAPKEKKTKTSKSKQKSTSIATASREEKPKKKKKKWKKKKKEVPIPDSVQLDKQSEFRRHIISRVYWRVEKFKSNASKQKSNLDSKPNIKHDPRLGYVMEYNPIRKCLFVKDVEVRFNDDLEVLQCTRCPYQTEQNRKFHRSAETLMFHHVLGKHLEIYKCTECSQVLGSLKRWQDHMKGHQMQFCCDICGKPMFSHESLYNHRWSHMNESEMQEALAKGMKDPREKIQRMKERGALRAFICTICGKGIQTAFLLKQHEQIHRKDRERIQCTKCGKTFLPMGFYSHQKYTCRPDGAPVINHPCHLCPDKVFNSKHLLKRHFNRTHAATAEERPHICEICGRGFKTRGELGRHANAHLETRPWVCGKGCGAAFKHKKNCSRHEGNCNGLGTPRGKTTATTASTSRSHFLM